MHTALRRDWPWPCEPCEAAEQADRRRRATQASLATRTASAGIPVAYQGRTLADLMANGWNPALVAACNDWVHGDVPHIFLYGANGVGKTSAAGAAAWQLALHRDVRWIRAATLARWIMADYGSDERASANKLAGGHQALVLDDLGQEQQTQQATDVIRDALEERLEQGVPILITSNFRVAELAARPLYGSWLGSRLAAFRQLHVTGHDHRLDPPSTKEQYPV